MENVTADFHNRDDMEQAAEALRKQGAVHIQLDSQMDFSGEPASMMHDSGSVEQANQGGGKLLVVVESSRLRQAEDTIARFGGETV